jgi:hypothetical protein
VINLLTGPDGSVFMIDWYDKNECHLNTIESHDRSNGRIFKISYGETKPVKADLQKLSDQELVKLLASKNSWHARHAQRILQERFETILANRDFTIRSSIVPATPDTRSYYERQAAKTFAKPREGMSELLQKGDAAHGRLCALWALHACGGLEESEALRLLKDEDVIIRSWTIQSLSENEHRWQPLLSKNGGPAKVPNEGFLSNVLSEFARMAREDKSPVVRLYLASALQRLPMEKRGEILEALLAHAEDATDHNLPLMYWYAAEPLAGKDVATAARLLAKTKIPQVRELITRRMTAGAAK